MAGYVPTYMTFLQVSESLWELIKKSDGFLATYVGVSIPMAGYPPTTDLIPSVTYNKQGVDSARDQGACIQRRLLRG